MKVIHFTKDTNFKLRKIEIKNEFLWCKPKGGLWTSPINSNYGWDKWCIEERYLNHDKLIKIEIELDVEENKNLIIIDKEKDLDKLLWMSNPEVKKMEEKFRIKLKIPFGLEYIDFEKMKERGIDAIYLTEKGQRETRHTYPKNLYGWDCECVLILNEICIKSWKIKS